MKTITKIINLYTYQELSAEAKRKALAKWNEPHDMPFLEENLHDTLKELLNENDIVFSRGVNAPKLFYQLSNSQGDGFMFTGDFEWNEYHVHIRHEGRYCHVNSAVIDLYKHETEEASETIRTEFKDIYEKICHELEVLGYDLISEEESEETFIQNCDDCEFIFEVDGTRYTASI